MSKSFLQKQKKFNAKWLKDTFIYYAGKFILKDEEGKEVLDEETRTLMNMKK